MDRDSEVPYLRNGQPDGLARRSHQVNGLAQMNTRDDSDTIKTVSDATRILNKLEKNKDGFLSTGWPFDRFPFGLWFRGQVRRKNRGLEPRVFRRFDRVTPGNKVIEQTRHDETNLYVHSKLRAANYQQTYRSAFDWLCLLQHYSIPTRLLDWSESILIALYFAVRDTRSVERQSGSVRDDDETESEIIALNARALNHHSKGPIIQGKKKRPSIASPDSSDTIVRSEIAATRSLRNLELSDAVKQAAVSGGFKLEANWFERFRKPVAVFPSRLNDRMIFQSSVFTLHGGKYYVEGFESFYENEIIPKPISLEQVNEEEYILQRYTIPRRYRAEIRHDLFKLGIHEGALFPELDRQRSTLSNSGDCIGDSGSPSRASCCRWLYSSHSHLRPINAGSSSSQN